MKQEKDFLAKYFKEKYEEFMEEHPDAVELEQATLKEKAAEAEYYRMKAQNQKPDHEYINPYDDEFNMSAEMQAANDGLGQGGDEADLSEANDEADAGEDDGKTNGDLEEESKSGAL